MKTNISLYEYYLMPRNDLIDLRKLCMNKGLIEEIVKINKVLSIKPLPSLIKQQAKIAFFFASQN